MVGEVFINGVDAQKLYGVIFGEESFTTLLTPPPLKAYIESKSALNHGKQVIINNTSPKIDERDIQLTFYLRASSKGEFLKRYADFMAVLQSGRIDIRTKYQPEVCYHCNYISCTQFAQYNGRLAKFVLKLNEPNPNNRS